MRIQVFLSHNGVCSRRDAMAHIQDGRVSLNGVIVREPSTPVDPLKDKIAVDGTIIGVKSLDYVLLNKPAGFVTTKEDAHAERTVMDLLPTELKHLVPVGRLDKDTEGLLLLTNDGDLTFRLTHPQFLIDKTYLVHIGGPLVRQKKERLERGVEIEGYTTKPARIHDVREEDGQTEFLMTIHEGHKRQIRLMMKAIGCSVRYLRRISQGSLLLGDLALGKWRKLTSKEVGELKSLAQGKTEIAAKKQSEKRKFEPKQSSYRPQRRPSASPSGNRFNRQRKNTRRMNNDHT